MQTLKSSPGELQRTGFVRVTARSIEPLIRTAAASDAATRLGHARR
jgi:hypothetical protein